MREVRQGNKARRLMEEVKELLGKGVGLEGEAAPETASLRDGEGRRVWIWGVSRWGGAEGSRVRGDVFR
jgi:hypothetical protein